MKKKFITTLLAVTAAITVSACGAKTEPAAETPAATETSQSSEATEAETTAPTETAAVTEAATETETETETAAETTAVTETSGTAPDALTLSDDIYSFQAEIDGTVYQFPMSYSDFTSYGWESAEDDSEALDAGYSISTWVLKKGGLECYAQITNFDINSCAIKDAYITGISIDTYMTKDSGAKVILPKGIEMDKSTREDAEAAYGTPSDDNTTDSGTVFLRYEKDSYQGVKLVFDGETKQLYSIDIENISEPENFEASEISQDTPEIVSKYQAPASISDDFGDYTFSLDDAVYQLPAPVSTFISNGWEIVDDAGTTVAGRDTGRLTLMKNNQQMRVGIQNYSEGATTIENCFLISAESDSTPMVIPKGITIGSTQEEVDAALKDTTFETDDSDSFLYYEINPDDNKTQGYEVLISKEEQKVTKIKVDYQPRYSDFTGE